MDAIRNRFLLCLLTLFLTLPLTALPTPELDTLAADIESFVQSERPEAAESRRLAHLLGLATEFYAGRQEKADVAGLERLNELRQKLSEVGRRVSRRSASTVEGQGEALTVETGSLEGTVLDHQGSPEASARIEVYSNGYLAGITFTDSEGNYLLVLDPGAYHVYVVPSYFLSPQLYRELNCRLYQCDLSLATLVDITSGNTRVINFNLVEQGSIEGQVLRHEDLSPVPYGQIGVFDSQGILISSAQFSDGRYKVGGLDSGQYYVASFNGADRIGHLYRDVVCPLNLFYYRLSCPRDQGILVSVSVNSTTTGIDLQPHRGAALEGRVSSRGAGPPLPYSNVFLFNSSFTLEATTSTDPNGHYRFEGQPAGRYYVYTEAYGWTPQFYKLLDCPLNASCQALASPIDVALGQLKSGIDFDMNGVGTLTGQVRDQTTGAPIVNAQITITAKGSPYPWQSVSTDNSGFYSFSNLPAFEYSLLAGHPRYVDEYFDNVDARLGEAAAATVKVLPGQVLSGRDFYLIPAGGISAKLVAAESGQGLSSCRLELIPADRPSPPTQLYCETDGVISSNHVDPGIYYLVAHETSYYNRAALLFGRGSCNRNSQTGTCNTAGGTPVEIRSGEVSGPFELRLEIAAKIQLSLSLNDFGFPTGSVRLFDEDGELYASPVYSSTYDFQQLKAGSYRMVIDGAPNWESKTWDGVPCNRWYCDPLKSQVITLQPGQMVILSTTLSALAPYAGCVPDDSSLCLNQGRFRVKAFWRNFTGQSGAGVAQTLTTETGYFYFFSPSNLEVMVKALNGCEQRLGNRFWVFAAGLTNVGVELEVEDTLTGTKKRYSNALAQTFQPILDIGAFATCNADESPIVPAAESSVGKNPAETWATSDQNATAAQDASAPLDLLCVPGSSLHELCLGGKFKVTANWRTLNGQTGLGFGNNITEDTAGISFFTFSNVELVVKILDACQTNLPGYWVFASGLTDVEVDLRIENLENGQVQTYHQEPGPFRPILDLNTFSCN